MNDLPQEELLSAYLDGELTAAEQARVEQSLASNPKARQLLEELRALSATLQALPQAKLGEDISQEVLRLAQRRMPAEPSELPTPATPPRKPPSEPLSEPLREPLREPRWRRMLGSRALLWAGLTAAVAILLWSNEHALQQRRNRERVAVAPAEGRPPAAPPTMQAPGGEEGEHRRLAGNLEPNAKQHLGKEAELKQRFDYRLEADKESRDGKSLGDLVTREQGGAPKEGAKEATAGEAFKHAEADDRGSVAQAGGWGGHTRNGHGQAKTDAPASAHLGKLEIGLGVESAPGKPAAPGDEAAHGATAKDAIASGAAGGVDGGRGYGPGGKRGGGLDSAVATTTPLADPVSLTQKKLVPQIAPQPTEAGLLVVQCDISPEAAHQRAFEKLLTDNRIYWEPSAAAGQSAPDPAKDHAEAMPAAPADKDKQPDKQPDKQLDKQLAHKHGAEVGRCELIYVEATADQINSTLVQLASQPKLFVSVALGPTPDEELQPNRDAYADRADLRQALERKEKPPAKTGPAEQNAGKGPASGGATLPAEPAKGQPAESREDQKRGDLAEGYGPSRGRAWRLPLPETRARSSAELQREAGDRMAQKGEPLEPQIAQQGPPKPAAEPQPPPMAKEPSPARSPQDTMEKVPGEKPSATKPPESNPPDSKPTAVMPAKPTTPAPAPAELPSPAPPPGEGKGQGASPHRPGPPAADPMATQPVPGTAPAVEPPKPETPLAMRAKAEPGPDSSARPAEMPSQPPPGEKRRPVELPQAEKPADLPVQAQPAAEQPQSKLASQAEASLPGRVPPGPGQQKLKESRPEQAAKIGADGGKKYAEGPAPHFGGEVPGPSQTPSGKLRHHREGAQGQAAADAPKEEELEKSSQQAQQAAPTCRVLFVLRVVPPSAVTARAAILDAKPAAEASRAAEKAHLEAAPAMQAK